MKRFHHRLVRYPELWGLTFVALLTRVWQLGQPNTIVFDEVYFREFASNYLDGHYFFDIHPPLVKLFFAGIGSMAGLSPEQLASGDHGTFIMRLLPALAGAMLVPLVYVIARQMGLGRRIASFAGLLVLLDNALLVESRFVLMDSLLLLFGMSAISCYLVVRRAKGRKRWIWVVATGISLGALACTKWSGLAIVLLLAITWLVESVRRKIRWHHLVGEAMTVVAIMSAMYVGCFAIHFALLPSTGEGDAFMTERFQATLRDNAAYNPDAMMPFKDKFKELNKVMFTAQSTVGDHPYASEWYSWPMMIRPVYYWQGPTDGDGSQGNIYMLGNPLIWWGTTISVATLLVILIARQRMLKKRRNLAVFLLAGYAVNFIPFAFIDRSMFLYHYLFALLFAILMASLLLSMVLEWQAKRYGHKSAVQVYWGIVIVVFLAFLYILPLSYGWPLPPDALSVRTLLPTWR